MSSKLPELKFKQVGLNLNVVIGDEPLSIKIEDKAVRDAFKEKMESYRTGKKTATTLKEIMATLKPISTEKKATKEKEIVDVKAAIKAEKNKAKGSKDVAKIKKEVINEVAKAVAGKKAMKALPEKQKALSAPKPVKETKDTLVDDLSKKLEAGKMSQEEIDKLQALLNKSKKAPEPIARVGTRRFGEY